MTKDDYVDETGFGFWFLGTGIWRDHVLKIAIRDLMRLFDTPPPSAPVLVDVGCGQGGSLVLLSAAFAPSRLIGVECDPESLAAARQELDRHRIEAELKQADCAEIDLPDGCADVVFCHQTFHHLVRQEESLVEFFRILRPGGFLLFAESTRAFIDSWLIRLLFRHPMQVQRSADEYIAMIRGQGFEVGERNISLPYTWWSRKDLGALEWLGFPLPETREQTLVNLVARKPTHPRGLAV